MRRFGALAIRIHRQGCTNRPFFEMVIIQKHKGCKATYKEQIGSYDPIPNKHGEKLCAINFERLKFWIGRGATPTAAVEKLLGLAGYLPIHPMTYIEAQRIQKKELERQAIEETLAQTKQTAESSS